MSRTDELRAALDEGAVRIVVKPGKRETRIVSTKPFTIEIAARAIEGAANKELLRFLKKTVGSCRIKSGIAARNKAIVRVER